MPLHIQDPANPGSEYLGDALLDACVGASAGGAAFAFVSAFGVKLLLRGQQFQNFLTRGRFELLFGVDAITDMSAVRALADVQNDHPSLDVRAFVPSRARSIFHPKFAWFDQGNGGLLITGSGNLTFGGLRWNIEAYSVERLNVDGMRRLREYWDTYLDLQSDCQLDPEDDRVQALLERNAARRKAMREAGIVEPEGGEEEIAQAATALHAQEPDPANQRLELTADAAPQVTDAAQMLVAEIPRAANRWSQANFDQATFFDFFGASATTQLRVYFLRLHDDGHLGLQEARPAVAVRSHNYRFELDAAAGLAYRTKADPLASLRRWAHERLSTCCSCRASAGILKW